MEKISVHCPPGFEAAALRELQALVPAAEALEFSGEISDVYRADLSLRSANRVLLTLAEFPATKFVELIRKAANIPWEDYLRQEKPIAFRVDCRRSKLYHEKAVAQRMLEAMVERLGGTPLVEKYSEDAGSAPQLVFVRIEDNMVRVSIDSSGEPLSRRGYRLATAKAPLSETLAAAVVLASGWDKASPFIDPFCGSGTLAIEAALLAKNLAPGRNRRFAFMDWPRFDAKDWQPVKVAAECSATDKVPPIFAYDRDAGAVAAAKENAQRAGVADLITFACQPVSALKAPAGPGWIVTNPPYGERLKAKNDVRDLYAQFGKVLRKACPGWNVSVLAAAGPLFKATGLEFGDGISTLNGGLSVRLANGRV